MRGFGGGRSGAVGVTVAALVAAGGGTGLAAPGGVPGPPPWAANDVRTHIPRGVGSGVAKPKEQGPPAWVREFVESKRFQAPGREKIRRDAPGGMPTGRWTEEGTQAPTVGNQGGGMGGPGPRGMLAPVPSLLMAADDSVAGPGLGLQPHYAMEEFAVREGMSAGVNLGNGDLVVRDTDLKINAPGVATRSDRFYNGLSSRVGGFGGKWSIAGGQDVGLEVGSTSVVFRGPSGFRATFTGSGSSWTSPAWFRGKLYKNGDGTWIVRSQGSRVQMKFTSTGFLMWHWDKNAVGLSYKYNADNTVASVTDAAGRVTTYEYVNRRVSKMTDSAGRVYSYTYDYYGQLVSSATPDGAVTKYTYDSSRRLTRITTARGVTLDFGYDSSGRVTRVTRYTDFNGGGSAQSTTFAYPSATTTTQTDPNGHTWTYTKDSSGRVTKVVDPLGRSRSQSWTAGSAVQNTTDGGGQITNYAYDSQNNPIQVKMPSGATSSAVYATGGSCGGTTTEDQDQPICITDDAQNKQTMNYDKEGNLLSREDLGGASGTTGAKVSFTYQRRAGASTGADCGGKPGQRCTATNGNSTIRYAYDADGNLTKITPPSPLGARTYEYDSLGRLIASTNGRGQRVTYQYDAQDRLLATTIPATGNLPARTLYKSYDADGNESFNDSVISWDAQNRQSYIKDPAGNEFSTWFDAAGNMMGVSGGGEDYRYTYNAANELTTAGLTGASCSQDTTGQAGCVKFTYDSNGKEAKRYLPNATVITTSRDKSGRAIRIQAVNGATSRFDTSWSYTAPGSTDSTSGDRANVQTRTDTVGVNGAVWHGSVTTYTYDSMSRLRTATEKTPSGSVNAKWEYTYDKAGNRTGQTRTGNTQSATGTMTYGYNAANQLTSINGSTAGLSYDADGNETANPGEDWVNVARRASSVSPIGDVTHIDATLNGTSGSYDYGYAGTNPGSYLLTWMRGNPVVHSLTGIASVTDEAGGKLKIMRAPSGEPLAITRAPSEVGYYVPDRQGTIMGILSGSGLATVSYAYDPYGNLRSAPGADAPVAWYNPILYAGGLRDHQTGLYRYGVRWYDPNIGRFTTPDPTSQENNPYLYAGGNPCNAVDLSGGSGAGDAATAAGGIYACGEGAVLGGETGAIAGSLIAGLGSVPGGAIGAVYGCAGALVMWGATGGFNGITNNPA